MKKIEKKAIQKKNYHNILNFVVGLFLGLVLNFIAYWFFVLIVEIFEIREVFLSRIAPGDYFFGISIVLLLTMFMFLMALSPSIILIKMKKRNHYFSRGAFWSATLSVISLFFMCVMVGIWHGYI